MPAEEIPATPDDLEVVNAEVSRELERIFGPESPGENGQIDRECDGTVDGKKAYLLETGPLETALYDRVIAITLIGAPISGQLPGEIYTYSTLTGELRRQSLNGRFDVSDELDPSDYPNIEHYRRALYGRIATNKERIREGIQLEQEMGLDKGAEAEYMPDFLQALRDFVPESSRTQS